MLALFCCAVALFLLLPPGYRSVSAAMVSLNGTVNYADAKELETPVVGQQYRFSAAHQTFLTRLLQGGLDFSYVKSMSSTGQGSDSFSPAARLGLTNEFFNLDLAATYSSRSAEGGTTATSRQYQVNLESLVDKKYWPRVSLYADQQTSESGAASAAENRTAKLGSSISWRHEYVNLNYNINIDTSDSGFSSSTTTSHFGKLSSGRSFFANRLTFAVNAQYSQLVSEFSAPAGSAGSALAPDINMTLWAGPDPDGTAVVNSGSLPLTLGAPPSGTLALVIEGDFRQSNTVYIYSTVDQTMNSSSLQWDVYVSPAGQPQSWVLHAVNIPAGYEAGLQRFVVQVDNVQGKDVKLLVSQPGLLFTPPGPVTFSRLELYRSLPATAGMVAEQTKNDQYRASLNISARPMRNVALSYFISHDNSTAGTQENSSLSQNVSVNWTPDRYFISSGAFQVSDFRKSTANGREENSRSYSVSASSAPLPAVAANLALTRSEDYEDAQLQSAIHVATLSGAARLYHDLDGQATLSYVSQPYSIAAAAPDSLSVNMRLTARFTPRLTCDLVENYSTTLGGAGGSLASSLGANWRLSDFLSLQSSFNHSYMADSRDSLSWVFSGDLALTRKINVGLDYTLQSHDTVSQSIKMDLNWAFSRYISLSLAGAYLVEENKDSLWTLGGTVSMRY